MKKCVPVCFLIVFVLSLFTGCSSVISNGSLSQDVYEMWHPVKNAEDFWIGRINPAGELVEYGIFRDNGYEDYELIVNMGHGDTPHVTVSKNNIYYLKSNQLYCFALSNPSLQNELMPQSMKDDEAGYVLQSFISIDDDWITLEATKWGINENNNQVHVPTKIAVSSDGLRWREII